jgi:hypothetical protein
MIPRRVLVHTSRQSIRWSDMLATGHPVPLADIMTAPLRVAAA